MTAPVPNPSTRNPLRRLYHWILRWAEHPAGSHALFWMSFAESSFFPIPPDVLLIALCTGKPKRSLFFAFLCTAGSVLGGIAGYGLGYYLEPAITPVLRVAVDGLSGKGTLLGAPRKGAPLDGQALDPRDGKTPLVFGGRPVYSRAAPPFEKGDAVLFRVVQAYHHNAFLSVLGAAFTPIPYKVFTIAGGFCRIPMATLISASVVGRGARFFLVAGLLFWFGAPVRRFIEKYFDLLALVFFVLLIGGFLLVKHLM